jgi:hypothetical protein
VRSAGALVALSLLAAPAAAEVSVRVVPASAGGAAQVELVARAAPLSEVLDRLGRQIGMKVVYEGGAPRQLVTLSLQGRTPAETVLALLEGQGLNYALAGDPTGAGAQTLLVTGTAPASGTSASSPTGPKTLPASSLRRPNTPPPGSGPDAIEGEEEDPEEDEPFDQPLVEPQITSPDAAAAGQPGMPPPSTQADPTGVPVPGPRGPGAQPQVPTNPFPVSPFAPQPAPYMPQPYPPLAPVVPGAVPAPGAAAAPQQQQPQQQQEATPPPG